MKKIIFSHAVTCICSAFIIHDAYCQTTNSADVSMGPSQTNTAEQNSAMPVNSAKDYRNAINIKAVRNFTKDFKDAKNVIWNKTNDGGYFAKFTSDSIRTMVAYDCNGSWTYSLRRYAENKMAPEVRTIVKSTFFDYSIMEVTEIKLPAESENIIYRVLIKHAGNFKILQICFKEMKIVSDYTAP